MESTAIKTLRETRDVDKVLEACGMDHTAFAKRLHENQEFRLRWREAVLEVFDSEAQKRISIDFYAATGRVEYAWRAAGYSGRSAISYWRANNKEYAAQWEQARLSIVDALEDEAYRRAVEGVEEPLYHRGVLVDVVRKYSDQLLILLLRANDPKRYRDYSKVEVTGGDDGPVKFDDATAAAKLSALMEAARRRRDAEDLA